MFEPTRLLPTRLSRYSFAVAASVVGLLLRVAIIKLVGHELPPYITFYPAVMVIALLAGLWPGIVATASAAALAAYFVVPPPGFHVHPDDAVGLALFFGMGVFMSVVAERYRRTRLRVTAYEKELAIRESREALHRSEERWAITLRSIGDAVLTCDAQGRITFLNPVAETLTGWSAEDAAGRPIQSVFRIVNEQTGEPSEDIVGQALREGCAVALANHTALLTRTGASIPIEDSAAPIKDASGNVVGVVLVFHDVTERRRTQQALRASEQRVRQKLESILSPEGNIENLELADIIDASALQSMMEQFHEFARIPMAIIDLKGQVLVGVGWQDVCTKFHRVNPESCRHCIESDVELSAGVPEGDFKLYHCKNNMWDVATPITVGGRHVGNVFTGQFFFEGETPDLEVFRAQAVRYGFDELAYLAALDRVPRLNREQLTAAMGFFMRIAELISKLSYSNVKLARSLAQRDVLTRSLRANEGRLRKLNRTLRALNNSNQALLHATDETDLLQKVCEIVVKDCEHAMVWIGYAEDDEARTVRPVAHVGFDDGYLEGLRITWADTDRGRGPTGSAIRTGKPCVCEDMRTDPQFAPWREEALKRGYASSLALPIVGGSRTLGAITIYACEADAFSAEEVELLLELAADLGYGLNSLRLRAAHEQSEEQLRISEERYRLLFENMAEGLAHCRMFFDDQGKPADFAYLDVNGAFGRLTGLEDVVGKRVTEIIPGIKEAHPELFEIYGRVATTGEPERFEFEFTPLRVWLSVSAYSNRKEHFVAVFHDVTKRKQAEQALQQALQKERVRAEEIQTLMDSVPAVVWIAHDPLGTVITGNRSSYELLRLPFGVNASRTAPESERPTNFRACKHGVEIPGDELPVQRAARGEVIRDHEFELVFDDGTVRHFAGNGTPLYDAEGRPRGAVCVFMDITERKRAEEALIRSEKLASVGRMAATIAHEINNPLAALMNTLYLAKTNLPSGGVAREYLEMADEELRRVAHLTRQALGFYRESSAPTAVCVSDVLHSAIRLLKNKTASKRARIETQCDENAQITGVAGELRQILTNLLANSLDAVAEGGVVKARVSARHTSTGGKCTVRVTIADNGGGIHPSVLPHLFEPFFTTKEAAGTGLGLWVSRQIVEKHGGRIQVHSSKDGRHTGTTFSFVLPADPAAVPRRKVARAGA